MTRGIGRLPPELEALVAAERDAPDPAPAPKNHLRARVAASFAAGAPLVCGGASAGAAAATATGLGGMAKLALAVVTASAVGGGAAVVAGVGDDEPAPPEPPARSVRAPIAEPAPAPMPSAPRIIGVEPALVEPAPPAPAPSAPAIEASAPPDRRAPAPPAGLERERALLLDARRALRDGDSAAVIAAVQMHARDFPDGELAEEREVLWVLALEQAGAPGMARARARGFARAHPESGYLPRIQHLLATETDPATPRQ